MNQLEHIQGSYQELQEKFRVAEKLEEQLRQYSENLAIRDRQLAEQNEKIEELKKECQHEHFHLLEREETIRLLRLEIDQIRDESKKTSMIEEQTNREDLEKLQKKIDELNESKENVDVSRKNIRQNFLFFCLGGFQDLKEKYQKMKVLLTRLKKELQEKNQQPKQSLIDLELADYEKTIKYLKDELTTKDKEIGELRDELTNSSEKNLFLQREIESLEEQKNQTDERANKLKTLLDATKGELQIAKDLEQERHSHDDHTKSLTEKLQQEVEHKKVMISELINEKQQMIGKEKKKEKNKRKFLVDF